MKESISVLQKIIPDVMTVLNSRYRVMEIIHQEAPIGRRGLAEKVGQSERTLRTETDFLREQGLVISSKSGMELTSKGERVFSEIHKMMGRLMRMTVKEETLAKKLKLQFCRILPGNMEENPAVLEEMAREAVNLFDELLPEGEFIVAAAGGSTMAEVSRHFSPELSVHRQFTFVPARGGFGEVMSIQANTVSETMAKAAGGENIALFAPDNLSEQAYQLLKNEPSIRHTMEVIQQSNCLLYSIGNAKVLMERRRMPEEEKNFLKGKGAVGEAFGCYFDKEGKIIHRLTRFGLQIEDVEKIPYAIAIAGGSSKACAIKAYSQIAPEHTWLVTDEGAANLILRGETL